jgi:hypothetical protein
MESYNKIIEDLKNEINNIKDENIILQEIKKLKEEFEISPLFKRI